jgi:hypothetical protein
MAIDLIAYRNTLAFPYAGLSRIRFQGTLSILFRIPLKRGKGRGISSLQQKIDVFKNSFFFLQLLFINYLYTENNFVRKNKNESIR